MFDAAQTVEAVDAGVARRADTSAVDTASVLRAVDAGTVLAGYPAVVAGPARVAPAPA